MRFAFEVAALPPPVEPKARVPEVVAVVAALRKSVRAGG
jgi:hypothetical protein